MLLYRIYATHTITVSDATQNPADFQPVATAGIAEVNLFSEESNLTLNMHQEVGFLKGDYAVILRNNSAICDFIILGQTV